MRCKQPAAAAAAVDQICQGSNVSSYLTVDQHLPGESAAVKVQIVVAQAVFHWSHSVRQTTRRFRHTFVMEGTAHCTRDSALQKSLGGFRTNSLACVFIENLVPPNSHVPTPRPAHLLRLYITDYIARIAL